MFSNQREGSAEYINTLAAIHKSQLLLFGKFRSQSLLVQASMFVIGIHSDIMLFSSRVGDSRIAVCGLRSRCHSGKNVLMAIKSSLVIGVILLYYSLCRFKRPPSGTIPVPPIYTVVRHLFPFRLT